MLGAGIPRFLTLIDTWSCFRKKLHNSASRRGGQWSPAMKWHWPSSIAALQSTMQDLKAPVQGRKDMDLPQLCYIPNWMRSKTVRFFQYSLSSVFFQFLLACTGRSLFGSSCVASATWSSSESGGLYDGFIWLAPQELWLGDLSKDHFPLTWQWK